MKLAMKFVGRPLPDDARALAAKAFSPSIWPELQQAIDDGRAVLIMSDTGKSVHGFRTVKSRNVA